MYKSYSKNANKLIFVLLDTAFGLQTFFSRTLLVEDISTNRSEVHSLQE